MKQIMKKAVVFSLILTLILSLVACTTSGEHAQQSGSNTEKAESSGGSKEIQRIGIAMPTKDLQRWSQDGANLKKELEDNGYTVDLQYANNDIGQQVNQIENMITGNCDVLVIASIDGKALKTALDKAKGDNITVISYDRLIMDSDAISYYATFDNTKVGEVQGQYIADGLDLENAKGPFNLEIVTGPTDDNNVNFFYGGAMSVLQKYIDEGKLVVKSGQVSQAECATPNWSTQQAQERFENILTTHYQDGSKLDAVLCSNDSTALGVSNAIEKNYNGDFPIITGQDCETANIKNIIAGKQSMSVFKDTRQLAHQVALMINALAKGEEVPVNDTETYNNGVIVVPSFLVEPVSCDKQNYKEILIDTGYYQESDFQ